MGFVNLARWISEPAEVSGHLVDFFQTALLFRIVSRSLVFQEEEGEEKGNVFRQNSSSLFWSPLKRQPHPFESSREHVIFGRPPLMPGFCFREAKRRWWQP